MACVQNHKRGDGDETGVLAGLDSRSLSPGGRSPPLRCDFGLGDFERVEVRCGPRLIAALHCFYFRDMVVVNAQPAGGLFFGDVALPEGRPICPLV